MKSENNTLKFRFVDIILFFSLLCIGTFHEYIACALSVAMCVYLLIRISKAKSLRIRKDFLTSAVVAVCFGYGLTVLWAVDRGMAFVGFLKFLPLLLYLFCLQQEDDASQVLSYLPHFGALLAVISAVGMQIPDVKILFSVADRLAGTFQYPNTFAIFLLVCELLLLRKPCKKIPDYVVIGLLISGFLYTGSRTALIVGLLANAAMLLSITQKKVRMISFAVLGGLVLVGALLALIPNSVLNRFLSISLTESTFVGRILYWVDALPLLLKYPFGMGYMGYYYVQQSIQTGVYSVAYAHNDLLQLILDVGLIPAGLFVTAIVLWFCKKTVPVSDKIIVGALCLHSLFDFNMQFVGMFFLLLLLLSQEKTDKILLAKPRFLSKVSFGAIALASLYIGASLMLAHFGARTLADTLYPYNTQNKLSLLEQTEDMDTAIKLSDEILAQNTEFFAPYSVKAKQAYSQGDFENVLYFQRIALQKNPFGHTEYESYCKMLITGIDLYQKAGDKQSMEICQKELIAVRDQLAANANRLSPLGKMIKDQPVLTLSRELQDYINKLGA